MDLDISQEPINTCPIVPSPSNNNLIPDEKPPTCPVMEIENGEENGCGEEEDDENNILSDIEEMIENAVDLDTSKFPEGATVRKKRVLEHRMSDPFSILPNGWIEVTHNSGLPVYLHKATRVCTFSRPYFLGKMSVRRHNVPSSSIPCFYIRKRQEQIKTQREQESAANRLINTPAVELKTAGDEDHYLNDEQIYDYSKSVFKFKNIDVVRFPKWSQTRQFQRGRKRKHGELINEFNSSTAERPGLPSGTKLITVPALNDGSKPNQKAVSLNPVGKSSVALLHDFVQKVLKNTISYKFFELKDIAAPYRCEAYLKQVMDSTKITLHQSVEAKLKVLREKHEREKISSLTNGVENANNDDKKTEELVLGIGFGRSKKTAKMAAAEKILSYLIPGLRFNEEHIVIADNDDLDQNGDKKPVDLDEMFSSFDILDTRIPDLCHRVSQPQPFVILNELVRRNLTISDVKVEFETGKFKHQKHEYILKVGEFEVRAWEGNKNDGKQVSAQQMLKKLYPKAQNWGDIRRLYNAESLSLQKEAQRYKRKLTSQTPNDLSEYFAVSSESIGLELRNALKSMEDKFSKNKHRELVSRPPVGFTAAPLVTEDRAHFAELCQRYSHLFSDDNLLNSVIIE